MAPAAAIEALREVGITFREASRRASRGMLRFAMAYHGSIEVEYAPGEAMLICRGCFNGKPWPCDNYERAERDLAALEVQWAAEDAS